MKQHISSLYPRDSRVLTALARVGYLDETQMKLFLRDKRISSYLKDGLIQRECISKASCTPEARNCYKLTPKGHKLCRNSLGLRYTYHAQSPAHDLRLAERYLKLAPEQQRTWQTETEVRDRLLQWAQAANEPTVADDLRTGKLVSASDKMQEGSADVFLDLNPITSAIGGVKGMV